MTDVSVCLASEVDSTLLGAFLRRFFGDAKGDFLIRHGSWWHRGDENRWVLRAGDEIAGYCGVIPTLCAVAGTPRPALWKMDLVISPEFRGRGLQFLLDQEVRRCGKLLLGFPNSKSARVHRRNGWRVREDLRTLLMPLNPQRMRAVRRASGVRGAMLRFAAAAAGPWAALLRHRLEQFRPRTSRKLIAPDFDELAAVAADHLDARTVTTWRDASYLSWRYGEAPYRDRIVFYGTGAGLRPRTVLVARQMGSGRVTSERWLDLFGDLGDAELLGDLVRFAAREAVVAGASQITALATHPTLGGLLRRCGFLFSSRSRFCWFDDDREIMDSIAAAPHHWCLGDSDSDEPDTDEPEKDEPEKDEP